MEERDRKDETGLLNVKTTMKSRHLRLAQVDQETKAKSYYRISNSGQLAKVCLPFLEEFEKGKKSFAISSINYKASQQRTVLGLASYFDHLFDVKILIISDSLQKGVFRDFIDCSTKEEANTTEKKLTDNLFKFYHHFDFLDLNEFIKPAFLVCKHDLLKKYDLIFWDTPVLSTSSKVSDLFSLIAVHFDSISLIVSPSASKVSNLNELRKYFDGHGINVNGVVFKEGLGHYD